MRALFKDNNGLSQTHDTAPNCAQQAFLGIRGQKSFLKMFKCIRLQQRHWQDLEISVGHRACVWPDSQRTTFPHA